MPVKQIAIACQGGVSNAAYAAGALPVLLPKFRNAALAARTCIDGAELLSLTGISGASGGRSAG